MIYLLLLFVGFLEGQNLLPVGGTFSIESKFPVWVSDRSVLRATETASGYDFTAKKTGIATYRLDQKTYRVQVVSKKLYAQYRALKDTLRPRTFEFRNGLLTISGPLSLKDWRAIYRITSRNDIKIALNVDFNSDEITQIAEWLEEQFQKQQIARPLVITEPAIQLKFGKVGPDQKKFIRRMSGHLGVSAFFDKKWQHPQPAVEFQLEFAEISQSARRQIGLRWPESIDTQVLADLRKQLVLNTLESESSGRVFARPTIVSRSGSTARFHSGGEFPVRYMGYRSSGVSWKSYGLTVDITPTVYGDRIQVKVETELSYPDGGSEIDGIPGIKRSSYESNVELKNQSVLMLTGLIQNQWMQGEQGLPLLRRIPVLGYLFASEHSTRRTGELVVFITPRLL